MLTYRHPVFCGQKSNDWAEPARKSLQNGKTDCRRRPEMDCREDAGQGPICPRSTTIEWMRRQFRKILATAGLAGTFKTLRKTSGTIVESLHPGAGQLHFWEHAGRV
jgi:hypothetical protein